MSISRRLGILGIAALALVALRIYIVRFGLPGSVPAVSSPAMAHFDHRPRHGGVVLMNGDTHFEVAIAARQGEGVYRVYFSDAVRTPIQPARASMVNVVVTRASGARQTLDMRSDTACGCWIGNGQPADDPFGVVRIGYEMDRLSYWIDVPASTWQSLPASGG